MTPDLERFLELATRPLANAAGEREEAKAELMARVGHGGVPLDLLDLDQPLARLGSSESANPALRRATMLTVFILLTGAAAAVVAGRFKDLTLLEQASTVSAIGRHGSSYRGDGDRMKLLADHVAEHAPDLPIGVEWQGSVPRASAVDGLALLQQQVIHRIWNGGAWSGLTGEEQRMIARLDPDNALWPLIEVAPHFARSIGSSGGYASGYYGGSSSVTVEAEFATALRLFSEAAEKKHYRDHSLSLKRRQLDAFVRSRSITEDQIAKSFGEMVSPPFQRHSNVLMAMAEIQCGRLEKAGDKDGLAKLAGQWRQLARIVASADPADVSEGGLISQLSWMGSSLSATFDTLGMPAEMGETERWKEAMNLDHLSLSAAAPEIRRWSGARLDLSVNVPTGVTGTEMLPSRKTELAYLDRHLGAVLAVLAAAFTGLVGLEACRRPKVVKGMSRGLMPLFQRTDHFWIGALGLAFSWLWWWTITRLSPLGMRDVEAGEWPILVLALQPLAGFVFGLVMLLQTSRWRWGLRGGFFGMAGSMNASGWFAAGLTGLALPAAGLIRYLKLNDEQTGFYLLGVAGMSACGLLWLLWEGAMNLFTPKTGALRPNLTMRVLLPWSLAGLLALLAGTAASTALERHWFAKDPLLPNWTSRTHPNALEERLATDLRKAMDGL